MVMRSHRFLITAIAWLMSSGAGHAQPRLQHCLAYEPAVVRLDGRMQRRTFPGPPNYSSIQEGDRPEVQWILYLSSPVCVSATPGDDLNGVNESGITAMQLVIMITGDEKRYAPLIGKEVQVKGTLFHSFSGHHRTPVLLKVRLIESRPSGSESGHVGRPE